MEFEPIFPTDRITYRDGQRLWARDLRDAKRREDRLRWLHLRYLHHTWGVSLGYEIQLVSSNIAIIVGPGYAVDRSGRDLVLAKGLLIPVPKSAIPELYVLTLRYRNESGSEYSCGCGGACSCSSHQSLIEESPIISWKLPQDFQIGDDVPLASATVANGVIQNGLDFRVRRHARRLVRPHIGWGCTDPGQTGWSSPSGTRGVRLVEVVVDTSDAGFTRTPYYFAQLKGNFSGIAITSSNTHPWPTPLKPELFFSSIGFISQTTPSSFTYQILRGKGFPLGEPFPPSELEKREWTVEWMGLDPVTGCAPNLSLTRIFSLAGVLTTLGGG